VVALTAQRSPVMIGGREVISMTYNGQAPAPTLRLKPGETLGVTLTNGLDQPTNFHTHGLHVSPSGNSDNVLLHLMPGETFQFEFQIPPDGISGLSIPGFFWYHPHMHGYTSEQVNGGMAGALIVEGGLDDLPALREAPERVLVLQSTQYALDGAMIKAPEFAIVDIYVNGQYVPEMPIAPGETQRWRVLNASSYTFMDLELEGHTLHQIAADGNALNALWSRDAILLSPGERADVLVQGGAPGRYAFRSRAWGADFQVQPAMPIATLVSAGAAVTPMALPETLFPFEDLRQAPIDRQRSLDFGETLHPFAVFVNGQTFDPDRVDETVELGATEEWRIRNSSYDVHPFHIHVNDFQVISVNGQPHEARSWEDTFPVPAFDEIVMRTRFLDFPGKFVYHCHILDHEDMGMMGIVEVVDPAADGAAATPERPSPERPS
ncbi:MAG: multicopper oxidase family protein, partial [Thermomicrobiales bacterium]